MLCRILVTGTKDFKVKHFRAHFPVSSPAKNKCASNILNSDIFFKPFYHKVGSQHYKCYFVNETI